MREAPSLRTETLRAALQAGFGLTVSEITFLPLGLDTAAAVYRASGADGDYFVKVRRDAVNDASLAVPRYLHEQGVAEVVPPRRTVDGALWHACDGQALIVYPFLPETHTLPSGQADGLWRQLGAMLRRVHETELPAALETRLGRETFEPVALPLVRRLDAALDTQIWEDPAARAVGETWRAHRAEIRAVAALAETLGARLRAAPPGRLCLCHADPHWDNVLVDAAGRLWLVDWDDTLLAARERDLMFVIGGISDDWATPRDTARFFEGYGPVEVHAAALAYYRADWGLQDLGSFASQVLEEPEAGDLTRQNAARLFKGLFTKGGIVEKALGSEPF